MDSVCVLTLCPCRRRPSTCHCLCVRTQPLLGIRLSSDRSLATDARPCIPVLPGHSCWPRFPPPHRRCHGAGRGPAFGARPSSLGLKPLGEDWSETHGRSGTRSLAVPSWGTGEGERSFYQGGWLRVPEPRVLLTKGEALHVAVRPPPEGGPRISGVASFPSALHCTTGYRAE